MNAEYTGWTVPDPTIPVGTSAMLADAARAAALAFDDAPRLLSRAELAERVFLGADGAPVTRLDVLVESATAEIADRHGVNLLGRALGHVDNGSAVTLVVDPVDGADDVAVGAPRAAFSGVLAVDGILIEALVCWLDTGRCWHALAGEQRRHRTTGCRDLGAAAVHLLGPDVRYADAWRRVAQRAGRLRFLTTGSLEFTLVAEGAVDAFADPGLDSHRITELAAAMVLVPAAGGAVLDAFGRRLEIDPDLTKRWSGVVAATPELAEQLAAAIAGTRETVPAPEFVAG